MKKKRTNFWKLFLMLAFLITGGLNLVVAQESQVKGKVTDSKTGEGIPGASIYLKGTTTGTISDPFGAYSIKAEKNAVLVFSFIGYTTQEIKVGANTSINVELAQDVFSLDEVIAVGYGTQKKKELTGAVSSVSSEEISKIASSDFTKSLQGQVAGVSVVESSGRPGDQANIQIRGLGSISSSVSPLFVVDGIPYESNPNISADDIASVDILKDGASAAIYGTRASNGVILITTKRGKVGETKVSFSSYYGIQNITSGTQLLSTPEHIYVDEMKAQASGAHSSILFYNPDAMDYNTDFVSAITNDNAPIQNHSLSLSGGKENITFNINSSYFNQDGILVQSGYERYSTRANATLKKGKFDAFVSLGVSNSAKENEPWGLYEFAMFQGPYRKPLGSLQTTDNTVVIPGNNPDHVGYLSRLLNQEDLRTDNSYNVSANLKYEILDGLVYQVNLGMNRWNFKRKFWQPQYLVYGADGTLNELGSRKDAILNQQFQNSNKFTMEHLLNYSKSFGAHKLSVLAGYTIEESNYSSVTVEKRDFISNKIQVFDGGSSLTAINGSETNNAIVGKLFRTQYNYADKYLISASLRYDGSSKFGSSKRYAMFPGVSFGWNVSEENFLKNVSSIKNLKLRASYGEVGNEGISPYLYDAYVDANIDYVWGPEASDKLGKGAIQRGYGNPNVEWETNITRNIGLDLLMFEGKLGFNADLYNNSKENMLLSLRLPASTGTTVPNDWNNGYNSIISNVGNMTNKGIELSSYYKTKVNNDLSFQVTGTFTKNINEITSLGGLEKIPLQDSKPANWRATQQDITTYMIPGYEAGAFFLIPTDGIIKTAEQLAEVKKYMPNAQLGDVKYLDVSGKDGSPDGKIDDNDRVYSGSGMPKFEAGVIFNLEYKGFDFSAQLLYSHGNKVFNGAKLFAYGMGRSKDLYYMWTPQNANSDIMAARPNSEHDNTRARSNYFLEDGSYLRVRNLSLGYTVPSQVLNHKLGNLRFYINAQNPFTFTKYEGYDPEVGGNGVSNRGIDKGTYPVTRKFMMGVQVDF